MGGGRTNLEKGWFCPTHTPHPTPPNHPSQPGWTWSWAFQAPEHRQGHCCDWKWIQPVVNYPLDTAGVCRGVLGPAVPSALAASLFPPPLLAGMKVMSFSITSRWNRILSSTPDLCSFFHFWMSLGRGKRKGSIPRGSQRAPEGLHLAPGRADI